MSFAEDNPVLFNGGRLHDFLARRIASIASEVDAIPKPQFLSTSVDTLVEHVSQKIVVEPLEIYMDRATYTDVEADVDVRGHDNYLGGRSRTAQYVRGTRITVSIPWTGDGNLWRLTPNAFDANPPRGSVRGNEFQIVIGQPPAGAHDAAKRLLDQYTGRLEHYLRDQRTQVNGENEKISALVRTAVYERRSRIEASDRVGLSLGLPLKRRDDTPEIRPLPLRRVLRPLPEAPKGGYVPEFGIADEDYEYILNVVRHEGRTAEATPRVYAVHDEEELRDILLAHLNGHFQGGASGETFRKRGKTDIRIEKEDRSAFVAECKIWRGGESFKDAADQLLGYLTWRDAKTALIFYDKNVRGFKGIQEKIPSLLAEHDLFLRHKDVSEAGEWRAVFKLRDDPAREVTVHVFLLDLYVAT